MRIPLLILCLSVSACASRADRVIAHASSGLAFDATYIPTEGGNIRALKFLEQRADWLGVQVEYRPEGHEDLHPFVSLAGLLRAIAPKEAEATLPRIKERSGGTRVMLYDKVSFVDIESAKGAIAGTKVIGFERADRAIAIQVEKDVLHPGTALTVMHQVADSLSDGDAELRERLLPTMTENAARLKSPASDERAWP